jgi:hypothetical protein
VIRCVHEEIERVPKRDSKGKGLISMKEPNEANRYHVRKPTNEATYQELEKWAVDPNCFEMEICAKELAARQAKGQSRSDDRQSGDADAEQRYHIPKEATQQVEDRIRQASRQELERWANDPNCFEMALCLNELTDRLIKREKPVVVGQSYNEKLAAKWERQRGEANPFDPRTEISADAKYIAEHIASRIVRHLWIIFVLLPFVAALLWFIVK